VRRVTNRGAVVALLAAFVVLSGCIRGVVTSLAERPATEPARIEGNPWRPLFLGDEQIFLRYIDDENLGVFSTAVLVDPGSHCVVGEVIRSGILNSDDGWTEPLCFEAAPGQTYRIRYRASRYQMINTEDGSVVAEASWVGQLE